MPEQKTRKMKEKRRIIMRRTKIAVLGMMMVLSMIACAGKAGTTVEETTMKSMEMESGESEENMIGMPVM